MLMTVFEKFTRYLHYYLIFYNGTLTYSLFLLKFISYFLLSNVKYFIHIRILFITCILYRFRPRTLLFKVSIMKYSNNQSIMLVQNVIICMLI